MIELVNLITNIIDYRGKTPIKLGLNWNSNGKYIALSAKNVKTGKLVNINNSYRGDEELYKKWMKDEVEKGDILITSEAPFGEIYYWNTNEKIILSQRLYCIRPDKTKIIPRFMFYSMCSDSFQKQLYSLSTGSTVTGLRQNALLSCSIKVYDFSFQQHIVDIMNKEMNC